MTSIVECKKQSGFGKAFARKVRDVQIPLLIAIAIQIVVVPTFFLGVNVRGGTGELINYRMYTAYTFIIGCVLSAALAAWISRPSELRATASIGITAKQAYYAEIGVLLICAVLMALLSLVLPMICKMIVYGVVTADQGFIITPKIAVESFFSEVYFELTLFIGAALAVDSLLRAFRIHWALATAVGAAEFLGVFLIAFVLPLAWPMQPVGVVFEGSSLQKMLVIMAVITVFLALVSVAVRVFTLKRDVRR